MKHAQLRRNKLFEQQGGLCFWCEEPMRHPRQNTTERMYPDSCTVDHLRDKLDPRRRKFEGGVSRYVACCSQCNSDRGRASETLLKVAGFVADWVSHVAQRKSA